MLFATLGYLFGNAMELVLENVRKYEGWLFAVLLGVGLAVWVGLRRATR